ncbi:MAG TPA: hypothetical protein VFX48_08645, partial [Saprospiraceae bacterium]|nr:hypothetical protein [Saprospiraceae bacterium]
MKPLFFFCGIGMLIHVSCAQSPKSKMTLDGKSYQISGWAVNQPDKQDPDLLSFKDGMMDSEGCHQYGFTAAAYQSTYENGKYSFSCVTKSSTEGEIAFTGTV